MRLGEGVSGWVAANRRVMANADARLDLQGRLNGEAWMPIRVTAVPLLAGDETLGVLAVYCDRAEGLTDAELRLARVAAEQESQRMPDDLTADAARLGVPDVRGFQSDRTSIS